jgi:hypothetical protein
MLSLLQRFTYYANMDRKATGYRAKKLKTTILISTAVK